MRHDNCSDRHFETWPHPFFARDTRAPIYPITVISLERREALRAFCGPRPTAAQNS
jgi:hypothetical protein